MIGLSQQCHSIPLAMMDLGVMWGEVEWGSSGKGSLLCTWLFRMWCLQLWQPTKVYENDPRALRMWQQKDEKKLDPWWHHQATILTWKLSEFLFKLLLILAVTHILTNKLAQYHLFFPSTVSLVFLTFALLHIRVPCLENSLPVSLPGKSIHPSHITQCNFLIEVFAAPLADSGEAALCPHCPQLLQSLWEQCFHLWNR